MAQSVLVTGAAGFIGSRVVRRLAADGVRVVATDRVAPAAADGPVVLGELGEEPLFEALASAGPFTAIVHLATPPPRHDDVSLLDAGMVEATSAVVRLLDLGRRLGAAMVFASTALVYGTQRAPFTEDLTPAPTTPYACVKLAGELAIQYHGRRYGQPYTILRPGVVYGPGQRGDMFVPSLVRALVAGARFPMTGGEQRRDFVFVDDLVELVVRATAARLEAAVVNAGGGGVPLREVAELAEALAGTAGLLGVGEVPYREPEVWDYSLDATRARELFGWGPTTRLADGLAATIAAARRDSPR
ncbi:MAG TPA: NAD(P)-dependent oxidoreductase [Polyangiaceae bacterium]|nr:NAD(P)-dependent oxidoreductase [Polyangiaceae bacterium]